MSSDSSEAIELMSEADLEPVLALLQGADPETVARKAGISTARLFKIRDDLLASVAQERAKMVGGPAKKIGRNEPCPCGSGKKYKHCCLNSRATDGPVRGRTGKKANRQKETEQARLIANIEKAFALLKDGHPAEAIHRANRLIRRYPDEDRLHDIVATGRIYTGECEAAIDICRCRLAAAEREKSYFIANGRYRDADVADPALSYYYPSMTWLQKYWIAVKAADYQARYPQQKNAAIAGWVKTLQTADDPARFPQRHAQGLALRRSALKETLASLKSAGPEAMDYLMPLTVKYAWSGLSVPEILSAYPTAPAIQALIDISMFGFAYASGASLHYLEKRGDAAVPHIQAAFSRDKPFDPIKTGIVSVLGNIRTPAAYHVLLALLQHESPHIVNWAGDALGKYDNVEALPAMIAANESIGGQQMIENAILRLRDLEASPGESGFETGKL